VNLAEELRAARAGIHDVKSRVSELIESVVPSWRPRFPQTLGWRFVEPDVIDIYQVTDGAAVTIDAIATLARAGFRGVVFHDHPAGAPDCECVRRAAPPSGSPSAPPGAS
jgi:hypothetical protein